MSSQQLNNATLGTLYEGFVGLMLGRLASMVSVPRTEDFGVDFYCLPRQTTGAVTHTALDLCSIQVKGGGAADLTYGGLDGGKNGKEQKWKGHEINWIKNIDVPFYLARVDDSLTHVDLYCLWTLWCVFWKGPKPPFKITCITQPPSAGQVFTAKEPTAQPLPNATGNAVHDEQEWTVDLGPPFVRVSASDLWDDSFIDYARSRIRFFNQSRRSFADLRAGVPTVTGAWKWRTNGFTDPLVMQSWFYWNNTAGAEQALASFLAPHIAHLGRFLEAQNDKSGLSALVGTLEWLRGRGLLDQGNHDLIQKGNLP